MGVCSDCLEPLDDSGHHCPQCGEHVDSLGECQGGCEL
jgi:predicted amidophosphoribosyltransferase